ncbi:MAG: hypothetical protein QOK27_2314, partial [Gemmatimonadales bacterium]|nr:hypothetical protein [Gemmatimonadales bacterium]
MGPTPPLDDKAGGRKVNEKPAISGQIAWPAAAVTLREHRSRRIMGASVRARGMRLTLLALLLLGVVTLARAAAADAHSFRARAAGYQQCPEPPYSGQRDPSNPLALPVAPGPNPLHGARFFVPGPAKGSAAGAIATLLGMDPANMPVELSWGRFATLLLSGLPAVQLGAHPAL